MIDNNIVGQKQSKSLQQHFEQKEMNSPSSKNNPQKVKKLQGKYVWQSNSKEFDQKVKRLTSRLSRQNVCKEHKLIAHMNLKSQVKLQHLINIEEFKGLTPQQSIKLIDSIPYLQWVNQKHAYNHTQSGQKSHAVNSKHSGFSQINHLNQEQQLVKLVYPNSDRIVILTGINKHWIEAAIKDFNPYPSENLSRPNSYKKSPTVYQHMVCQVVGANEFWIAIEADSVANALAFKKFIRQRKKACEERRDFSFKEEKKRVRIVMQNEDFYTLLVDAMTQKKNLQFTKRLVNPNSGIFPTMCLRDQRKVTVFPNEDYHLALKKANKVLYFPITANRHENKESEEHFTLQQVYSEDRSKTSELFDSINNMNDLIEKADRGTQAQSLGVGTHESEIEVDEKMNTMNEDDQPLNQRELSPSKIINQNQNLKVLQPVDPQQQNQQNCSELEKKNDAEHYHNESGSDLENDLVSLPDKIQQNLNDQQNINLLNSQKKQFEKNQVKNCQTESQASKNAVSLQSLKEPQVPKKFLRINFSIHTQTQMFGLNYTKLKRLQAEYQKKSSNRLKLAPGIPEDFRQISHQERNKQLFFQNLFKSMEKRSQKKQFDLYY